MNHGIKERIDRVRSFLQDQVKLVVVSKTRSKSEILEAYRAGQRVFGENRTKELAEKAKALPSDISWHMIGHLQTNKVKEVAGVVDMIESVDSFRLLKEIDKRSAMLGRTVDCLLEVKIAREQSKYGFSKEELLSADIFSSYPEYPNVRLRGLMGMATFSDDINLVKEEFTQLADIFNQIKSLPACPGDFNVLSMGMSGDWRIALECGSNMVRMGTAIFEQSA